MMMQQSYKGKRLGRELIISSEGLVASRQFEDDGGDGDGHVLTMKTWFFSSMISGGYIAFHGPV